MRHQGEEECIGGCTAVHLNRAYQQAMDEHKKKFCSMRTRTWKKSTSSSAADSLPRGAFLIHDCDHCSQSSLVRPASAIGGRLATLHASKTPRTTMESAVNTNA